MLYSGQHRASGKALIDHAVGTASVCIIGDGDDVAIASALLHAVYQFGDFGDGRFGPTKSHRRTIAREFGDDVEATVFGYQRLSWNREAIKAVGRNPGDGDPMSRRILLIRVANEIDDAADAGLVFSGKDFLRDYDATMLAATADPAGSCGSVEMRDLADRVLRTGPMPIPNALVRGGVVTIPVLPKSARWSARRRIVSGFVRLSRRSARWRMGSMRRS